MMTRRVIWPVGAAVLLAICAMFLSLTAARAQISFVKSANFSPPSANSEFDLSLDEYIFRLIDPDHKLSFDEVANLPIGEFQPLLDTPSPGYTHASVWYRADIQLMESARGQPDDEQGNRLFLEIAPPFLDRINVAIFDVNAGKFIWRDELGDNIPFTSKTIRNRTFTARLPYLAPGHYRFVFRVDTTSTNKLSASILNDSTLMSDGGRVLIISSIIIASLFVIGSVYFTGGILVRDMILFWYGAYVLSIAMLGAGVSGLGLLTLQPYWTPLNDLITGGGSVLSIASSTILWVEIIDIRQLNLRIYKFYRAYCIIVACMVTIVCTSYYTEFGRYVLSFDLVIVVSLFGWLIYRFIQNPHGIYLFYLFTIGIPALGAIVYICSIVGFIPHYNFTQMIYPIVTLFHLIMMGIAMAYRTSYLEKGRLAAQGRRQRTHQLAEEQREFITMLGHEFRTPLAIIQRSAELISLHLGNAGQGISDRMMRIRNHAGQLSALVDVFLTKDTLDRGAFNLNRKQLTLLEFLSDLVESIDQEGKQIDVSLHGDADTAINADPILLKLAIGNVIENARKYAPNSPILIDCNHRGDGYAYIRVVDHGPGMTDDDLSQVSIAFYRGKSSDGTRGVGLGLHIANRILEAHHGSITLSVAERGGTTVVFKLPLDRDATIHNIRHRNMHRLNSSRAAHQTGAK